jgi:UDPglucose 6-dehydrogenase
LLKAKIHVSYVSNPEFLREGKAVWDWYHPDRIVIGSDDESVAQKITVLYSDIDGPKEIMDLTSAEMVKYASNAFLATKISFINEISNLCELVGADIDKVAHSVGMDSRIGHQFLQAGLGYGGSCFPKDAAGLDYISSFNGYL